MIRNNHLREIRAAVVQSTQNNALIICYEIAAGTEYNMEASVT